MFDNVREAMVKQYMEFDKTNISHLAKFVKATFYYELRLCPFWISGVKSGYFIMLK